MIVVVGMLARLIYRKVLIPLATEAFIHGFDLIVKKRKSKKDD